MITLQTHVSYLSALSEMCFTMANSVEFRLQAPYNSEACLLGDFADGPVKMNKGDDGWFRTAVKLEDGEHRYKFRVRSKSHFLEESAWVEVIDPRATAIDAAAQMAIARVEDGERILDTYQWKHDLDELPGQDQLIIYELLVQDFSRSEDGKGTFLGIIDKLDYLQSLGINAIEMMPVQSCPMEVGWGYNCRHYFAPRTSYGRSEDLKQLVDECHGRGIKVILDMVINHSESESPLTQIDFDYWYRREPKDPDNSWGPEFDYEHYDEHYDYYPARDYMREMVSFWVSEYHVDGLRFDAVKQIDNPDFLNWLTDQAGLAAKPGFCHFIAEHIPEDPSLTGMSRPFDSCWRISFHYDVLDLLTKPGHDIDKVKKLVNPLQQGFQSSANIVNYATSHDQEHLMVDLGNTQIFGKEAFKRVKLAGVLVMTALGIPMMWMGEEFGIATEKSLDPSPLNWSLLENSDNKELFDHYQGLIHLRTKNGALRSDNVSFFHENPKDGVIGYVRWDGIGPQVAVVINCSENYLEGYEVHNLPEDGAWHEWTGDYDVEVKDGTATLDLSGLEAKVLVWG